LRGNKRRVEPEEEFEDDSGVSTTSTQEALTIFDSRTEAVALDSERFDMGIEAVELRQHLHDAGALKHQT